MAEEYNRADVFCLPGMQEGFGIVFLEAMAAGKAIVAARFLSEIVKVALAVRSEERTENEYTPGASND